MKFLESLKWRDEVENFDEGEKKICLALSDTKYLWRSFGRLEGLTRLDKKALAAKLDRLMADGWVRPSISAQSNEPIYGLVERVGPAYSGGGERKFSFKR